MGNKIENTIPVLAVKNLDNSMNYYVDILGFKEDWRATSIGSVSRDSCSIMLREELNNSTPTWVWIGVRDTILFEEWINKNVYVFQEPQNHEWAYEMKFEDPDGNILWLGTEKRNDLPVVENITSNP